MPTKQEYGLPTTKAKKDSRFQFSILVLMFVIGVAALSFGTQRIADLYRYDQGLGAYWFIYENMPIYAPWSIFFWQDLPDQYGIIMESTNYAQAIFVLPMLLICTVYLLRGRKLKGNDNLHGSAHWARYNDIKTMTFLEGQGVYIGGWMHKLSSSEYFIQFIKWLALQNPAPLSSTHKYLRHNGPEHILCFAPTRSGKGVGLILPTLLSWLGSIFVLDIKGENWALTAGYRQSLGHICVKFDPSDPSGASACFNPLEEVRLETMRAIPDVQNIATMIVDPEGKGMQDHWSKAGFAFVSGVLLHCLVMIRHKEKRSANLNDLGNMMADPTRTLVDLYNEMLETPHKDLVEEMFPNAATGGDEIHTFIASSAREMMNKAENEGSGVVSTALVNLALYRDPVVSMNTSRCDFRISDLMNNDQPVSLYLITSPTDLARLKPLIRLILNLIVGRICEKMEFEGGKTKVTYKHRLLLLLDEFTSLGRMEIIEKAIAYVAGYGIKMYIIVQDVKQLNNEPPAGYGKSNALMSNCHVRIAYAPNDQETAELLSKMLGTTTVVEKKTSISGSRTGTMKNANISINEVSRPLLTPDECTRLPGPKKNVKGEIIDSGDMLIFSSGQAPIYGKQILYFRDPTFSERSKCLPPIHSNRLLNGSLHVLEQDKTIKEEDIAKVSEQHAKILQGTLHYFEDSGAV